MYEDSKLLKQISELSKEEKLDDKGKILLKLLENISNKINKENKNKIEVELEKCKLEEDEDKQYYNIILSYNRIRILKIYLVSINNDDHQYILLTWRKPELGTNIPDISYLMKKHTINTEDFKDVINNIFEYNGYEIKTDISKGCVNIDYNKNEESPTMDFCNFQFPLVFENRNKLIKSLIDTIKYLVSLVILLK